MRICVMQPYFIPYVGYFRLCAQVDLFILFDDVQFPRRGYVHRNQLRSAAGTPDWFTLPLRKAPQSCLIQNLAWSEDAPQRLMAQAQRFPALATHRTHPLVQTILTPHLSSPEPSVVHYLKETLVHTLDHLQISCPFVWASEYHTPSHLTGEDRILFLCETVGATDYLNPPGGIGLYTPENFKKRGIRLEFLPPFSGNCLSILDRLLSEPLSTIQREIHAHP